MLLNISGEFGKESRKERERRRCAAMRKCAQRFNALAKHCFIT